MAGPFALAQSTAASVASSRLAAVPFRPETVALPCDFQGAVLSALVLGYAYKSSVSPYRSMK